MLTRVTLYMSVLLLSLGPAQAHVPEGTVRGIWYWPADALPVMDGDLSEWMYRQAVNSQHRSWAFCLWFTVHVT